MLDGVCAGRNSFVLEIVCAEGLWSMWLDGCCSKPKPSYIWILGC